MKSFLDKIHLKILALVRFWEHDCLFFFSMEALGMNLKTLDIVIIKNLLLMLSLRKPDLKIYIKQIHYQGFSRTNEIIDRSLVRSMPVNYKFFSINA